MEPLYIKFGGQVLGRVDDPELIALLKEIDDKNNNSTVPDSNDNTVKGEEGQVQP